MLLHAQPEQSRPRGHIFTLDCAREGLVLHLLQHSFHLDVEDRLRRLDQRARRQKARQLVARAQRFIQLRLRHHARVVGMRQNSVEHGFRPPLLTEQCDAHKRMLLLGRMAFIVHVVQQAGTRVHRDKLRGVIANQPEPRRLRDAIRLGAHRHSQPMLAQALALRPLLQQFQRAFPRMLTAHRIPPIPASLHARLTPSNLEPRTSDLFTTLVPLLGFSGFLWQFSAVPLDSLATQCHSRHIARLKLSDVCCGSLLWVRPQLQTMATMMASVEQREVLRCDHCNLVQFRTTNAMCRRCHKCLEVELPEPEPAIALVPSQPEKQDGLQVATAVRDLRHVRNLSQRQLAARMGVPRTYISKIENGKAMPTLSSLDRLARALKVDIASLLRDSNTRHRDETAVLMTDPFLAEIAMYTSQLDDLQRSIFLNHVRELAAGRRRTA